MFKISYLQLFITSILLFACNKELILSGQGSVGKMPLILESVDEQEAVLETSGFIGLPDEIMLQVFNALSVKGIVQASQVCQGWNRLSEDPILWRTVRLRIHGDYPVSEATREQAKLHMLRVHVNTLTDLTIMEQLITKYNLNKGRPFVRYQALACKLLKELKRRTRAITDEQSLQGSELVIERKMKGLTKGTHGYKKDSETAIAYNESLIKQGNEKAIERKMWGLTRGFYGYKEDPEKAFSCNEHLVGKGNQKAIDIKVYGLSNEFYGYKKDPEAAFCLNEYWVEQGSIKAIERKIRGLAYGFYGYAEKPEIAVALNEQLVEQGIGKAIRRKIKGLVNGRYGYEEDLEAALAFNEKLIEEGNQEAIIRKIEDLSKEKDDDGDDRPLYHENLPQLKSWIQEEERKGTRWACYLASKGLKYGILGFEKNQEAAIEYIKRYNLPY